MKKILALLIVITFTACHSTKYTHSGNVNSRLDFKKGKWLLYTIDAPKSIKESLTNIATEKFTELLGNRFSDSFTTRGILLPSNINNDLIKADLKDIKNGTGSDFFIKINAAVISDEVGVLGQGNIMSSSENRGEVTVTIYDLNLLEEMYSQSVVGNVFVPENYDNLALTKSAGSIIIKGLERIMKNIHKNQIKN
ncbi:hypothetical protein H0I31_01765 [Tenacibaculum sp. AHE15PA]|uniref:hypothetical protein n=1 Tax=unclassified Tenacibaculum TaxID=2635139 RepID=UPI001C4F02EC|nr:MULTISPECIES: hypothetical protein [unclassified Tenacibaculum]QXP72453.1 hypothetical protein H0I30_07020 [Tenacibaculum sp. AHE14PA]QXP76369.1 hypothetical protein H0I31_01765 [Tenacibaculum sp. AHE15PA]